MAKKEITVLFENTTLAVADPITCYKPVLIENCLPGRWKQATISQNFGPFGERNSLLVLEHEDLDLCNDCLEWTHAGEFGVDTGTAAIYDPDLSEDGEIYGVQCSSGIGDGCYPVHVTKNKDGKVIAIRADFDIYNFSDEKSETPSPE